MITEVKKKHNPKRSLNARRVGEKVLENFRNGKKVILGEIIKEVGYAETTSTVPSQVTNTLSYQEVVDPVIDMLKEERFEIIKRLKKTRNKAKYRDLIDGLDKTTKNIQLLSGKRTGNETIIPIYGGQSVQGYIRNSQDILSKKEN